MFLNSIVLRAGALFGVTVFSPVLYCQCMNFTLPSIPFSTVDYILQPLGAGQPTIQFSLPFSPYYGSPSGGSRDSLLVGGLISSSYLNAVPLPNAVNQRFCSMQELAPGFFADAYVPTFAERSGNYASFSGLLFDPATYNPATNSAAPFPGAIIPSGRLYGTWAWRIFASTVAVGKLSLFGPTTVTTSSTGVPPPTGFTLGNPPIYYDISTTAKFSVEAQVCINYSGVVYANELNLHFFHLEDGAWVDRTNGLNTSTKQICAAVTSFSPFAVFEPAPPPPCAYSLSAGGQTFTAAGGMGSVDVAAGPGCVWPLNIPDWITVTGSPPNGGNGTVTYQVAANVGGDRSAILAANGPIYTVEQQGGSISGLNAIGSLAHVAAEENWTSTFTLVSKSLVPLTARLSFFGDAAVDPTGNGRLSLPLTFPQILPASGPILASTFDRTLVPHSSLLVATSVAPTSPVLVGSAQLAATGAVDGFAIFHHIVTAQEAVVPMETRNAPSYLLSFDNTKGLVLGIALENVTAANAVIPVIIRDENGVVISAAVASISVPANGHFQFGLSDQFPVTANIRGTIEFDTPAGGQISVLGLRFTPPNNALTTIPALANVGTGGGSIAHLASGGDGWQTTFVLVNTGASAAQATLGFYNDVTGAPLSLPLTFPQGGADTMAPSVTQTLAAGATLVIVSGGVMPQLFTGSAQLTTAGHITGFVIFRHNDQEGVVPLESRNADGYIIAFDNTGETATGIAVNAVSAGQVNIPVTVRDSTGTTIATDTLTLSANGHTQFTLVSDRYPMTANIRGTIEFDKPAAAQIGALGIRIQTGTAPTYTTLPALAK